MIMTRRYAPGVDAGSAPKVPYGRWRTTTFIAGLRHDGIITPFVIDGPIDGASFLEYVVKVLVPERRPGDIVVLIISAAIKARPSRPQSRPAARP
jgi:hypothetical protein